MDTLESLLGRYVDGGETAAMDELVARTGRRLLGAARRIGNPQDAEDSVQAAYHSLLRRAARPFSGSVVAWLLTTVVRIAYRRKAVNARESALAERLAREPADDDPVSAASAAEHARIVREEVARLPAKYRDPIVLHHFEGLTTAEIGRLFDAPQATVKARLQRGRRLLRGRLDPRLGRVMHAVPWWLADIRTVLAAGGFLTMKKLTIAAGAAALVLAALLLRERNEPKLRETARKAERTPTVKPNATRPEANAPPQPRREQEPGHRHPPIEETTVRVRVTDDAGRGLPFAAVVLRGGGEEREAAPKRSGQVVFENVARHVNWELLVRKLGYEPGRAAVDLSATNETHVVLQRPPERELTVTVVDHEGNPETEWHVNVSHDGGWASGLTNSKGRAAVTVRGEAWQAQAGGGTEWRSVRSPIPDPNASSVQLVVPDTVAMRGRVLRPDGKPYANAMLRLERDGKLALDSVADQNGNFVIRQAADAGLADVVFAGAQVQFRGSTQFHEHLGDIGRLERVPPAADGLVLRTAPATRNRGLVVRVRTDDGRPAAGVWIKAYIERAWIGKQEAKTGSNGVARLFGLAARSFRLELEPGKDAGLLIRSIRIPRTGDKADVVLLRSTPWTARLRYRGAPVHGASISLRIDGEWHGRPVRADADGRFTVPIPADHRQAAELRVVWSNGRSSRVWVVPLDDRTATDIELAAD